MKSIGMLMLFLSVACIGICTTSCGDKPTKAEQSGPEYDSAYICPMHCEGSGSAEVGVCPVCGMDYVANENFKGETNTKTEKEEHSHDGHDHDGHDHGDHEGHSH